MTVKLNWGESVLVATIDRPERRNAVDQQTLYELASALDESVTRKTRVVIITGTAPAFCSGADLSGVRETTIYLGPALVIIFIIVMVMSASNGVNLTDGLDGLATGASIMTFLAFVLIGVWEFGQSCGLNDVAGCYAVRDPLDLAVLAAALAGACGGFLWWNASPA
ncbi:MAG: hypothetical protein RLZZ534_1300, partial [Actinomycetota bacterium]